MIPINCLMIPIYSLMIPIYVLSIALCESPPYRLMLKVIPTTVSVTFLSIAQRVGELLGRAQQGR